MRWLVWATLVVACGGEITVEPASIDFGEVDFQRDRPDGGYDPIEVTITHVSGGSMDLVLRDVDDDRVVVGAQLAEEQPPTLPTIDDGGQAVLTVGVWDYEPGELDTEVQGGFRLTGDGLRDDVFVPWTYTPVRAP